MVWILLIPRPKGDFRVTIAARPLCNGESRVGFSCQGAIASRSRAADDDINLLLDRSLWLRQGSPFSVSVLIRRRLLVSDVPTKLALPDEVFDLVLQVMTFLRVVAVFLVETIISPIVTSLRLCPDRIGGPEEPLVSDLEEDLRTHRIEGRRWLRSEAAIDLDRELARKLNSNSLANESKEEIDAGLSRLVPQPGRASECGRKSSAYEGVRGVIKGHLSSEVVTCSEGSKLPS
ncbi:hypothetical protein B296_00033025 [Ensete ventricosum]|uniref:Uncharacterized protein n=1 Tax=Ensete ventricosum TaxID=4639 RepID=A0A426XJF0_ENSVE|nr:hypothetical protein B296_00033025 [Ensete ventricosum]